MKNKEYFLLSNGNKIKSATVYLNKAKHVGDCFDYIKKGSKDLVILSFWFSLMAHGLLRRINIY